TELLLISIVAILFLGPDKLPTALVEMAKFIKSVKKTIGEAKSSLEEEMKIADLKEEALNYKKQLDDATNELKNFKNIDFDAFDDVSYDDKISKESPKAIATDPKTNDPHAATKTEEEIIATQVEAKNDTVTFKKTPKKKKKKEATDETTDIPKDDA
ncbi:MAG: Sec-independent protein translocase protein TatB, partial [Sulfurovum sp.]|nr:Sec-independent protein translocase protein TatB [Sulfurovum sp.]